MSTLITILSLIISCRIISEKKIFWNDELYSYYFLSDPSFTEMMSAFGDKINNTPFLYFGLGWVWDKIFGSSELSLRLFSSVGIGIACLIIWRTLRKTYNFWSTAIGTLGVFCTSEIILSQNAEARMYGLFLMLSALAFWQFDYLARKSEITRWDLSFTVLIHAAIIHTHLFGPFYSGAILFALIIRDKLLHKLQPKIYLSIIGSWFSFLLYIPAFLVQADAGTPRTWLPIPTLQDFIEFMSLSSSSLLRTIALTLIILISGWQVLTLSLTTDKPPVFTPSVSSQKSEASLLIFAYIFLGVPIFVWLFSLTIKPIFWDRYMIPSIISWCILLAYLSSRFLTPSILVNNSSPTWVQRFLNTQKYLILSGLLIIFLIHPITYAKNYQGRAIPGTYDTTYGYEELPIVVQPSAQFLERRHYAKNWQRYYFILDWEAADAFSR